MTGPDATSTAAAAATHTAAQRFCCALAGVDGISERFADAALAQSRQRFGDDVVDELLHVFGDGGLDAVVRHPQAAKARALTYLLYTGVLPDESGAIAADAQIHDEADYFESVMWRVIQAHPRGLSGGYYGHWHYPPEDGDGSVRGRN